MKTLILIRDGDQRVLINPADLKSVTFDGKIVSVNTSVLRKSFRSTKYAVDQKFKPAIRDRYNVVNITKNRVTVSSTDKRNTVVAVSNGKNSTYIFPRALKWVAQNGNELTIAAQNMPEMKVTLGKGARLPDGLKFKDFSLAK